MSSKQALLSSAQACALEVAGVLLASPAVLAAVEGLRLKNVVNRFAQPGTESKPSSPEKFSYYINSGAIRWAKVIGDVKIAID